MKEYKKRYEIINDNFIRIIEYDRSMRKDYTPTRKDYIKQKNGAKSEKSLYRTRNEIKNIIDANVNKYSKFITLTFKEDIKDRQIALERFKNFTKRYKYHFQEPLKYIGVMELQNGSERHGKTKDTARNVWHFHIIVFNERKLNLKEFDRDIWQNGHCNTKKIDSTDNIGRYLMKYITKEENEIGLHKKYVLRSQGLKKPLLLYDFKELRNVNDQIINDLVNENLENQIKSDFKNTYTGQYDFIIPERVNKKTGELIPPQPVSAKIKEYKKNDPKAL